MITVQAVAAENDGTGEQGKRRRGRPKKADQAATAGERHAAVEFSGAYGWDIETGPQDESVVLAAFDPFVEPLHPGEFDPNSVKLGNLKKQDLIDEKIEAARSAHLYSVENFDKLREDLLVAWKANAIERAPLDAMVGRVEAIGWCAALDGAETYIISSGSEVDTLHEFWSRVSAALANRQAMIGWNIHGFDLPFVIRRSWFLEVPIPAGVRHGRYWNDLFIDLMKVWAFDAYGERMKLDTVAQAMGLEGKFKEISGKDFWRYWRSSDPQQHDLADKYLRQDGRLPIEVAKRMGVISFCSNFSTPRNQRKELRCLRLNNLLPPALQQ